MIPICVVFVLGTLQRVMASRWRRTVGNVGGLRGGSNLASWVVAGTLAYFLWINPSQHLNPHLQTRKPVPHPHVTGLIYGNKNKDKATK